LHTSAKERQKNEMSKRPITIGKQEEFEREREREFKREREKNKPKQQ
jgi:hypothetical protein